MVAGGGEQAAQKTRLMLKTEAEIIILSDALDDELAALADEGRITQQRGTITSSAFENTALVFIATGCPAADASLHALAKKAGATVNVVDQPDLCDAITPSIVDRDPVIVAIGTEGTAPVLARQIKTQVEQLLEPRLGDLAALAGRLRDSAAARLAPRARRDMWRWVFSDTPRRTHARGAQREAAQLIKDAIHSGAIDVSTEGSVSLVGAGPGAKDLITLRGVQRLQEADVIFYDRLVDPEILDLARRDAERIYVGKAPGCHSWPQEKITQTLVRAAQRGQRIVRLKCGDPSIFARSCEEITALKDANIPYEIVPGVTSACAAAASVGAPLTERDEIDTLVISTGHITTKYVVPNCVKTMQAGTCVTLYMAVGCAPAIAAHFQGSPAEAEISVVVVAHAQTKDELIVQCNLQSLAAVLQQNGVKNTALITLKWRKSAQIQFQQERLPSLTA